MFSISCLRIYHNCSPVLLRILEPGIYHFNDNLQVDIVNDNEETATIVKPTIAYDWFAHNISVQAIVGMNGSGKSSLMDIIYRLVNNFGVIVKATICGLNDNQQLNADIYNPQIVDWDDEEPHPAFVSGLHAKLYYIADENGEKEIRWIECNDGEINIFYDGVIHCVNKARSFEELQEHSEKAFYTIGSNYAAQAHLPSDYKDEYCPWWVTDDGVRSAGENHSWIDGVFHKNDGYSLPICLNPYRSHGVLDMRKEMNLTQSRLAAIIDTLDNRVSIINGYTFLDTTFTFEPSTVYGAYKNADRVRYYEIHKFRSQNSTYKCRWDDQDAFLLHFKSLVYRDSGTIASHIISLYKVPFPTDETIDVNWWAYAYLVKKTLSIAGIYPTYKDFRNIGKVYLFMDDVSTLTSPEENIKKLVEKISKDRSHITLKIRQTIYFLTHNKIPREPNKPFSNLVRYQDQHLSSAIDFLDLIQEILLPPIFKSHVRLKGEDGNIVSLDKMSSGERQQLFSFATILYHIINILSIQDKDRIKYRNINVVLDEIEICFHPEYQRTLLSNLLSTLNGIGINIKCSLNIIICTHSPFLLSDIPDCNQLLLEKGHAVKKDNRVPTFCANIYDLFHDHFFLNNFIGKFALKKLDLLIDAINSKQHNGLTVQNIRKQIDLIGDEFIKEQLYKQLSLKVTLEDRIEMEEEIHKTRINSLRKQLDMESNDTNTL